MKSSHFDKKGAAKMVDISKKKIEEVQRFQEFNFNAKYD